MRHTAWQECYLGWLMDEMKREEETEEDVCEKVERSLMKKFRRSIWCQFTKAVRRYELVKRRLRGGLYFRRQGFHADG